MATRATVEVVSDSAPSSPSSELSLLRSSKQSSKLSSSNPSSRASSAHAAPADLGKHELVSLRTNLPKVASVEKPSDSAENTVSDASAINSTLHSESTVALMNDMSASKQNLLGDSIKALDMDWSMSSPPKGEESQNPEKPKRKISARLNAAAKAMKETASVLGKRSRDAIDSGKDKLKDSMKGAAVRKGSLRVRLTDDEKEQRRQAEEASKHAPAPDAGNRPKLPRGWAYVYEPPKKKTRLSEAEQERRKQLETAEAAEPEAKRPMKDGKAGVSFPSTSVSRKYPKLWVESGLYSGQSPTFNPSWPGWRNRQNRLKQFGSLDELERKCSFMPLPIFSGKDTLQRGRHFKLPFDIYSPLPKEPKPEEWQKIRSNRFVGDAIHLWKHQAPQEMSQCFCTLETGCGDNCLNRGMMYECDQQNCPLDARTCSNRPFANLMERVKTRKQYEVGVEVLQTSKKGFGVRASRSFNESQIIVEYAGEIITKEECERRMMNEYKGKSDFYLMEFNQSMIIDATKGSIARFVNHSCEPNCTMEQWVVSGKPRMALFAKRDIMTGEELTYDYNFDPFSTKNIQTCHCGSTYCRGTIGPKLSKEKEKARLLVMNLENQDHQNFLRQFAKPFPKYTPLQALTDARKRLADLFGQTVDQFFSKKEPMKETKKRSNEESDEHAASPKSKKQRVVSAVSARPTIPKRVSSARKAMAASSSPPTKTNRQSEALISSTSTGQTTLVDHGFSGPLTKPDKTKMSDTVTLVSPAHRKSIVNAAGSAANGRRSSGLDLERDEKKRRSVKLVNDE